MKTYKAKGNNNRINSFYASTAVAVIIIVILTLTLYINQNLSVALALTSMSDNITEGNQNNFTINNNSINQKTTSNFLTYNNSALGIEIQYPINWEVAEHFIRNVFISEFISPLENTSDRFPENVNIVIENMAQNNTINLDRYTSEAIKLLNSSLNVNNIELGKTTLAGDEATKLLYTTKHPAIEGDLKVMQVYTVKDNRAYIITYTAESDKYDTYLPIAQRMIDSFEITNLTTTPATNGGNMTGAPTAGNMTVGPTSGNMTSQ